MTGRILLALAVFFVAGLTASTLWNSDTLAWAVAIPSGLVTFILSGR